MDSARTWIRELLATLVMEEASELELHSGAVPRLRSGIEGRDLVDVDFNPRLVVRAMRAITRAEQWEALARGGRFDFGLLALGIGRFAAHAYSVDGDFHMVIRLIQRFGPDGELELLPPGGSPPPLRAEAEVEI